MDFIRWATVLQPDTLENSTKKQKNALPTINSIQIVNFEYCNLTPIHL